MLSSAFTLTLISNLFLASLALPSDHQTSAVPTILANRATQPTSFSTGPIAGPSAVPLESSAFPPNISTTDPSPETNLTTPPFTCYTYRRPLPYPTELDCFRATQSILLEPDTFEVKIWSGTRGLRVAQWTSGTCRISLVAETPFSEDAFPVIKVAWAAAYLIRACVVGAHNMGGVKSLGQHTTFRVTLTGSVNAVGGGTATS